MNDIRNPDSREEVIYKKREMDISNDTMNGVGDDMAKTHGTHGKEVGLKIFYTILAVYGFLTFLNPSEFPITRGFIENTPYFYIAQYERLFGVILVVIGLYLLQEK